MGRSEENRGFTCANCGCEVLPLTNGSYRNHCPFCLWSKHVDCKPGDRANTCDGMMEPIGFRRSKKKDQLVYRCRRCGIEKVNRIAENTKQPDNYDVLLDLVKQQNIW